MWNNICKFVKSMIDSVSARIFWYKKGKPGHVADVASIVQKMKTLSASDNKIQTTAAKNKIRRARARARVQNRK